MRYLVYFDPSQQYVREWKEFLATLGESVLEIPKLAAHCTLFVGECQESNEVSIIESLRQIQLPKINAMVEALDLFEARPGRKMLVAKLYKTEQLLLLHMLIADTMKSKIDWSQTKAPLSNMTASQAKTFSTYGSPFFGQFWSPHVSICEVADTFNRNTLASNPFQNMNWLVETFVLAKKTSTGWTDIAKYRMG